MAKWTPDQLSMFSLWTSEASPSATSSPGSGGGPTPSASPGGPTTGLCGLEAAPASRFRSRAKAPELTTPDTSGPTFIASSPPADPLSSWESRLRERLGTDGSMEFELIWKQLVTPGGRSIFRLSRSTPRTFANASTGSPSTWWTPKASQTMGRYSRVNGKIYPGLWMQAEGTVATTWPTPRASDEKNGNGKTGNRTPEAAHRAGWTLPELTRATWPTPTKADGDGGHVMGTASATGRRENGTKITVSLPGVVKIVSTWPTPRAVDGDKGSRTPEGCEKEIARKGRLDDLPSTVMHNLATWPTVTKADSWNPSTLESAQREWDHHNLRGIAAFGTTTSGSPGQTENRGALAPTFPCWLMGYPITWDECAPKDMPKRSKR